MKTPTETEKQRWRTLSQVARARGLSLTADMFDVYGNLPSGYKINNHVYDDLTRTYNDMRNALKINDQR